MASKLSRFWNYAAPLRRRFGLLGGMRVARGIARAEYRSALGEMVAVDVPDWPHPVMLRAGTSDSEVFRQVLVGRELEIPLDRAPTRILDGGMNFGLASLVFAYRWPMAQIVGVELEPRNAQAARHNCAETPAIQVLHAALWDTSGTVQISDTTVDAHSFQATDGAGAVSVRAYRLGELLDELGWDTVDLVKLDIEGAERRVLADAASWLPRVQHLLVELHDRFEPGCTEAFMAAVGGDGWTLRQHGEYMLASRLAR